MSLSYLNILKKSWDGFKRNPVLILPLFVGLALFIGFLLVVGLEVLVFIIIFSKSVLSDPMSVLTSTKGILLIVFFSMTDLVFVWMISSYIKAMQIGMYLDVTKNQKTTSEAMFKYGKRFFKVYFKYQLAKFVMFIVPILVLASVVYLCYLASKILAIIIGVLALLLLLGYITFIGFGLFFIEPMIVTERKGLVALLKQSVDYSMKNLGHVIITGGIIIIITMCVGLIMYVIKVPVSFFIKILEMAGSVGPIVFLYGLGFLLEIIMGIVNVVLGIVLGLFVFNAYFAKKKR
ncbi:hypothetical protein A3K72_01210 [Candidatus Woesearchaeota archaeon RBG_13_36_6]|nr:MAG: hypothetical protein A3K72_01210 [Candidatus Woesearchaeota archaeon RBG_13_36_6]